MKKNSHIFYKSALSIAMAGALMSLNSSNLLAEEAAVSSDEQQELGAVSVTASRVETEIKDIAGAISIIDKEELDTLKFTDATHELMKRIPGYSMVRNLRIPIGGKNYTVNLIDGLSIGAPFGSGTIGFGESINTQDIERIEVVRGPASALYGSHALGGVVNIITRKPPAEPELKVWGEGGQNSRSRGGVSAAGSNDTLGYFVDVNTLDIGGWQDRTAKKRTQASGKAVFDLDMDTELTVRLESLDILDENPGSLSKAEFDEDWSQAGVDDAYNDEQSTTGTVTYKHNLSDQSGMEINYGIRQGKSEGPPSYSAYGAFSTGKETNQNLTGLYRLDLEGNNAQLIAGIDLRHSVADQTTHVDRDPTSATESQTDVTAVVTSPFVQYDLSPTERMRVSLGARYDSVKYSANQFVAATPDTVDWRGNPVPGEPESYTSGDTTFTNLGPKAGVTYELNANNSIWVSYGQGFVVPGDTALYFDDDVTPNPDLNPEKANDIELGLRGRLASGVVDYDIALYRTDIRDMVVENTNLNTYVNAAHVRVQGLESALSIMPVDSWKIGVAHTYADNQYIDYVDGVTDYSGNTMSSSPLHHINAHATWIPIHGLAAELEWNHVSAYHTNDDNSIDPDGQYQRPDIFNLRVSYKDGAWGYWGHVKNLADTQYAERVSYSTRSNARSYTSGAARNLYAGVSYSWK